MSTKTNHVSEDSWREERERVKLLVAEETREHSSAMLCLSNLHEAARKNKEDRILAGIAIRVARTEKEADLSIKQFHELRFSSRFTSLKCFKISG